MSYTDFDFPNTRFYESDLRQILKYYKDLHDQYNILIANIRDLQEWRTQHEGEYAELVVRVNALDAEVVAFEAKMNEDFATLEANLNAEFASLADGIREQLQETIAEIRHELEVTIAEINTLFNELKRQVNSEISLMKLEINELEYQLSEDIISLKVELDDYLNGKFQQFIDNLPDYEHLIVHNPVTGTDTTIQIAINDLYLTFNVFGLTAKEFDELGLTCEEFDATEITAYEFDSMGYKKLHYPDPDYYMRDPFTGNFAPIKDVVMKLYHLHAGTITANAFDAMELTCDEFDALNITAFDYDFSGISA